MAPNASIRHGYRNNADNPAPRFPIKSTGWAATTLGDRDEIGLWAADAATRL
jgi:hypothetical protein